MSILRKSSPTRITSDGGLPFDIKLGESLAALGMRNTGKTSLVTGIYKGLVNRNASAVGYVIDSNIGGDFTGWSGGYFGFDCPIIKPSAAGRQVVWQPPKDDYEAYEDFFLRLFEGVQNSGIPAVLFIDELSALGNGAHDNYARLLKRGRKRLGFAGISVLSLSQEFAQRAKVPRQTFSQMTHFVRFYVQHPYDVMQANMLMHLPLRVQPEHEHGFWHARMDRPPVKPTYYRGKELLGL